MYVCVCVGGGGAGIEAVGKYDSPENEHSLLHKSIGIVRKLSTEE